MSFARHQTFYLRAGWMAKALDELLSEEKPFIGDQAAVRLGIGRNMVQSLRFWVQASWIGEMESKRLKITRFGRLVADKDPYFEDELTWWLIHYYIATRESDATSWYFLFNVLDKAEFTRLSFIEALKRYDGNTVSESSYQKDFDCILASYLDSTKGGTPEDNIGCPLSQLSLLGQKRNGVVCKSIPEKRIPVEVLYLAMKNALENRASVSMSFNLRELRNPKNICTVFNLSADATYRYLDLMQERGWLTYSRTAGLDSVTLRDLDPWRLLENAYDVMQRGRRRGKVHEDK